MLQQQKYGAPNDHGNATRRFLLNLASFVLARVAMGGVSDHPEAVCLTTFMTSFVTKGNKYARASSKKWSRNTATF